MGMLSQLSSVIHHILFESDTKLNLINRLAQTIFRLHLVRIGQPVVHRCRRRSQTQELWDGAAKEPWCTGQEKKDRRA